MQPRWPYPRLIAHRCGGTAAPENTLAGLRAAARLGFRAVEFDVMLCADRTAVLIHDETLDRTCDGSGRVADLSYAEIAAADAGIRFGAEFAGERIPTLEQAASLAQALGLWCNVEIKPSAGAESETGRVVAAAVARLWAGAAMPPLLSSFSPEALVQARRLAPDLPRGLLLRHVRPGWLDQMRRLDCLSLHTRGANLDAATLAATAAAGVPLLAYTVNALAAAQRLLRAGVAAVFTDRLDLLAALDRQD